MDVMQTAEPTANPANSPTALVSVATARVTNIMLKVTMTSMTSACQCGPVGVVVPITVMGCSTALSTNDAQMAPVNCAAQ
jgi:hypothetical protein